MPPEYTLSVSTSADNLALATLHAQVFSHDLVDRALFPDRSTLNPQIRWSLELLARAAEEPDAYCIKAVEKYTRRIVGAAMVQSRPPKSGPPGAKGPFDMIGNQDFFKVCFGPIGAIWKEYFGEREHSSWNSLVVLPEYQGHGIGTALLRYGLQNLNMNTQAINVTAVLGACNLYAKFGWKKVGEREVDLSEWCGGKDKGFGNYKCVLMVREPEDVAESSTAS